ncbi:hypothetical protein ES695_03200 [Candidatus Atribacteria bacterium 1244-E10-H5-B2]|nr:MAG: hypothetical protein ES695_03200 [Candidatus Atribacteria bacterium 1244-E10-H5-B2]
MTKEIDSLNFLKDYREGKSYEEIAISQGCSITTVGNRVRRLGLKRNKQKRKLFSAEERYLFSKMIETRGGRKQLLEILRGD